MTYQFERLGLCILFLFIYPSMHALLTKVRYGTPVDSHEYDLLAMTVTIRSVKAV